MNLNYDGDSLDDTLSDVIDCPPTAPLDLGMVAHVCVCGSQLWNLQVMFEDYEISMYFTKMTCAVCNSVALAPTLLDKEGYEDDPRYYL